MKKISVLLSTTLVLSGNSFAGNTLTHLANMLAKNINCPKVITIENGHFYGAPSVFNRCYGSTGFPPKTAITFYFRLAAEESGTAICIYLSSNQQMSETIYAGKPLKANIDALHNNWSQDASVPGGFICLYNANHCPYMNY